MNNSSTLFLFTGQYPYSEYVECFLEDEIIYLSKRFDKVVVVPTRGDSFVRMMPKNCESTIPIFPKNKLLFLTKGLYNKRSAGVFLEDFVKNRVFFSRKKFFVWIKGLLVINNFLNSNTFRTLECSLTCNDICYYYWGKWSNLLALFIRTKCHHISRFHGAWDLWEDEFDDYAPLRKQLSIVLDTSVFISKKGQEYFKKKYNVMNTMVSPLGSKDFGVCSFCDNEAINIVSCSTIYPLKRVDLIYKSVIAFAEKRPRQSIKWTHIGGGPDLKLLKEMVASNNLQNLCVELSGGMKHDSVIEMYRRNKYNVFVNLSTNEGVPVSIMEAISFNIPVVATDVGGTSEIVTQDSGILVPENPSQLQVAEAICEVLDKGLSPRTFWSKNYCAENNYTEFANYLYSLIQ